MKGLMRTHTCGELNAENVGQVVELTGWVNKERNLGGLYFIDLRDKYGLIQLSFDKYSHNDLDDKRRQIGLESVLQAKGKVRKRPESALNKQMATGEIEIEVNELNILSLSDKDNLPFLPTGKIEATEDLKLKYRYLNLRAQKLQDILRKRADATFAIRQTLRAQDFIEVETPILYKSTPEGARDYLVPSRVHPGHVYALPQSPQTLKQLLMIGGTDKYFQITKCFRDEDLRADRQPEFTQVDIEVSFCTQEYIKNITTAIVKKVYSLDENFEVPVMSYAEAMDRYGSDKPDIRFGLEHRNVTAFFEESSFSTFNEVAKQGGLIKTFFVPAEIANFSRKDTDSFKDIVTPFGGKGVAFFKVENGQRSGGISKFIDDELYKKIESLRIEGKDNQGTWLFFADKNEQVVHDCADALRRNIGDKYKLHCEGYKFLWVNDFPLFEWDEGEKRFFAKHHPFTMPKRDKLDVFLNGSTEEIKKLNAEAYDIVCNGHEIGGGSLRIFDQGVQRRMFELLGMTEEEVQHQFGFFIEALRYGTPPHGGIALGLDRVTMILVGTNNIRDVIAFPKTTSATDLMSDAPSRPSEPQIKELNFKWIK